MNEWFMMALTEINLLLPSAGGATVVQPQYAYGVAPWSVYPVGIIQQQGQQQPNQQQQPGQQQQQQVGLTNSCRPVGFRLVSKSC